MAKKSIGYTHLKDVDHKLQYANLIGVISGIAPSIKRKKLSTLEVEICDGTLSNPGFFVVFQLESDMLDQFLAVAKRGLIIELVDIKIAKNDGEVKGEVKEEEEIHIYKDDGSNIKWWPGQKRFAISDKGKCAIEKLTKWKKNNFNDSSKTQSVNNSFQHDSNLELSTRSSSTSKKIDISSQDSPKRQENKNRRDLVNKSFESKEEKTLSKATKSKSNSNIINAKKLEVSNPQENDRKRKLDCIKATKSHSVSPNRTQHTEQSISRRSLREISGLPTSINKTNSNSSTGKELSNSLRSNSGSPNVSHKKRLKTSLSSLRDSEEKDKPLKKTVNYINRSLRSNSPYSTESQDSTNSLSPKKQKLNKESPNTKANELKKESIKTVKDKGISQSGDEKAPVKRTSKLENTNNQEEKISDVSKSTSRNSLKSSSKEGIKINKVDRLSTSSSVKSPSKQIVVDINEMGKVSIRELDKNPSKKGTVINKDDKISTPNVDRNPTKQDININKKDKTSTDNFNKISSKQILEINKVDKISTLNSDKNASKQSIEKCKLDKISTRNLDNSLLKHDIDIKKGAETSTGNLDKRSSKQDIDINKRNKIRTRNLDKSPKEQNSPIHGSKLQSTSNEETNSNKPNRKTKSPKDTKGQTLLDSLGSITRKIHLIEVESAGDVSFCELEDVDVPEKLDLRCKVIAEFSLFEENIQVIRVQDGTISKSPMLTIPKVSSWKGVVAAVVKNPIVKKNSPYIDIIIFDFPLMDNRVEVGQFYEFKNIMAVRLNLKYDPRQGNKPKNELFFCAKGPNTYNKKLLKKQREEIEEKLGEEKYKKICLEFDDAFSDNDTSNLGLENAASASKQKNVFDEKSDDNSDTGSLKNSLQKSDKSPANRKRKLPEPELDSKVGCSSNKRSLKGYVEKNLASETKKGSPKQKTHEKLEPHVGILPSSDETMLGETECLIVKELSEIMHEESQLGLSQIYTEDVHLKNTGSEITFSQFCHGAKEKAANFRTSTQNEDLSDSITPLNQKETKLSSDSSKMEPLVYCPSSPSSSEKISPNKNIKGPEMLKRPKECSESILLDYKSKAVPEADPKSSKTISPVSKRRLRKDKINNPSTVSDILSVEVISSTSSDIEFEEVNVKDLASITKTKNVKEKTHSKSIPHAENNTPKTNRTLPPKVQPSIEYDDEELKIINEIYTQNSKKIIKESNCDKVESISDSNSSILSEFSVENNSPSAVQERSQDVFTISQGKQDQRGGYCDGYYPTTDQECKKIPESCFFKSSRNPSTEDIDYSFNDENNSALKYFSYSLDRHLPFLTFDIIRKVGNKNYITVAVTIEKISPSLTDSWQEECMKSHCPCCNKVYNAFNALNCKLSANTNSLDALSVSGLVVCPESQCCNQVLDSPEFHFSVDSKLKDGSPVTALIAGKRAENIFGCNAREAAKDETVLNRIRGILQRIATKITEKQIVRVDFARENIFNPNSGPLFIQKFHF